MREAKRFGRPSEVAVSCDDDRDNNDDAKRVKPPFERRGVRLGRQDRRVRQNLVEKVARMRTENMIGSGAI